MEMLTAVLSVLGLKLKVIIAGAIGSFISLTFFDNLKLWERFVTFCGGCALAAYTATFAASFFELMHPATETALAILIGMFGMSLAAAIIKVIKETQWSEIIKRRIGGEK